MSLARDTWLFPDLEPAEPDFHRVIPAVDIVFPSDNELEIPTLRADMQAEGSYAPLALWGSIPRRDTRNVGTWHFYGTDDRFEQLWRTPGDVVATGCRAAVEPNFSKLDDMPLAFGLQQLYRKRWIARWWQDQGIRIFADLYVGAKYQAWNLLGLPPEWRAFATRGSASNPLDAVQQYYDLREWAGGDEIVFLVYSGGTKQAAALRDAQVPAIICDHYRDENISKWYQKQPDTGLLELVQRRGRVWKNQKQQASHA